MNIVGQIVFPTATYALTSGPSSPEFSSFEPVVTTDMVNEFTGDFVYNLPVLNVPGPHGSGYAISLSYHAGTTPEEEASWVGYGWTLNPGAINRQKRGFADDANGADVTYYNKMKRNFTTGLGVFTNVGYSGIGINAGYTTRYNNYKGFASGVGIGGDVYGVGMGYNYEMSDGTSSFSVSINPANIVSAFIGAACSQSKNSQSKSTIPKIFNGLIDGAKSQWKGELMSYATMKFSSSYGIFGTEFISYPVIANEYVGFAQQYTFNLSASLFGWSWGAGHTSSYNYQENKETTTRNVFGYLYSHNASNEDDVMDYYTEKALPFQKDNRYLGMPVSNADMFIATGEGISGGFRFYNKNVGTFRPAFSESTTNIYNTATAVNIGGDPLTVSTGTGKATYTLSEWSKAPEYSFKADGDEAYYARFDNDLGGGISYGCSDKAEASTLSRSKGTDNDLDNYMAETSFGEGKAYKANSSIPQSVESNEYGRVNRSSYIGYHTNKQISEGKAYNLTDGIKTSSDYHMDLDKYIDRSESAIADQIGEIVTYNENGLRYNYGLPVYARNEVNMRYGLSKSDASRIEDNYLVYKDKIDIGDVDMKVGEVNSTPYATNYLLTDITTNDFIDRTLNGPSDDDFGGYTKFNYSRWGGSDISKKGSESSYWYNWRIPYNGLLYDRGEQSIHLDDAGFVTFGEKEIYYLSTIETKTHIAVFDLSYSRNDGIEAAVNSTAANSKTAKGSIGLRYLNKIELYTKDANGNPDKLLQTTHFEYDYSAWDGLPNSKGIKGSTDPLKKAGKLTLKKIWTDYQGIYPAKISPYEFTYEYKKASEFATHIQESNYGAIAEYGNGLDQKPDYNVCNIDAWGNYQDNGSSRTEIMQNWLDQRPNETFDPAAWQLKQIKLPSGGEILVQYEQKDYQYVQNYPAFGMVKLKMVDGKQIQREYAAEEDGKTYPNHIYYLDVSDLGISDSDPLHNSKLDDLRDYLYDYFRVKDTYRADGVGNDPEYANEKGKNMIYAKFLYAISGNTPDIDDCNSEYVTGFVYVNDVDIDEHGLYLDLGKTDFDKTMKDIAHDFVKTNRMGINSSDCFGKYGFTDLKDSLGNITDPKALKSIYKATSVDGAVIDQFLGCSGANFQEDFQLFVDVATGNMVKWYFDKLQMCNTTTCMWNNTKMDLSSCTENHCEYINRIYSYLRIPLNQAKKGGGIRVKRLLMYDSGMAGNTADVALYGNEYVYQKEDGKSSGVATNEPASIREENGLVQLLKIAEDQGDLEEVLQPEKRQVSGPLGESLYPGASVGHSRVVIKNIHSGETNPGFTIKQFYTAYDYPVEVSYTDLSYKDNTIGYYTPDPGEGNFLNNLESLLGRSMTHYGITQIAEVIDKIGKILADFSAGSFNSISSFKTYVGDYLDLFNKLEDLDSHIRLALSPLTTLFNTILDIVEIIELILQYCDDFIKDIIKLDSGKLDVAETAYYVGVKIPVDFTACTVVGGTEAAAKMLEIGPEEAEREVKNIFKFCKQFGGEVDDALKALAGTIKEEYINKEWATQGYSVVLNSMHGQPKQIYTYESSYDNTNNVKSLTPVNGESFEYIKSGDSDHKILNQFPNDYDDWYDIGKVQEVVMESKDIKTYSTQSIKAEKLETVMGIIPEKTTTANSIQELCTHITTKIIHEPSIVKAKYSYANGMNSAETYYAFNKHTGKPLVSMSTDEFNGLNLILSTAHNGTYTNYLNPASYEYDMMGPKAYNEGFRIEASNNYGIKIQPYNDVFDISTFVKFVETTSDANATEILDMLNNGDLIVVRGYYIPSTGGKVYQTLYYHITDKNYDDNRVTVVPINQDQGEPKITESVSMEVLQSARTNQLNEIAGTITTYGSDVAASASSQGVLAANVTKAWSAAGVTLSSNTSKEQETFASLSSLAKQLNQDAPSISEDVTKVYSYSGNITYASGYTGSSSITFKYLGLRLYKASKDNYLYLIANTGGKINFMATTFPNTSVWRVGDAGKLECVNNGIVQLTIDVATSWKVTNIEDFEKYNGSVLSASAVKYTDDWAMSDDLNGIYGITENDEYIKGAKGKWRPVSNYIYNTTIKGGSQDATQRIYTAGTADKFYLFDWSAETEYANWSMMNEVTSYSPNGDALEEKDALGIYSTAKFGYDFSVPCLTAANADYKSVHFEGFENYTYFTLPYYTSYIGYYTMEENYISSTLYGDVRTTNAHSGSNSFQLKINSISSVNSASLNLNEMTLSSQLKKDGMLVRFWLKQENKDISYKLKLAETTGLLFPEVSCSKIARVGEWSLYEAEITNWRFMSEGVSFTPLIKFAEITSATAKLYIDDIRVQPSSSEMNCFVYDPVTLRLLTAFDSQHFGLFYQYNAEGKLIRKIAETEKGKRTIKETHYNTATESR